MKYVCALGAAAVLLSVASAQKAAGQDCGQNSDCAKGKSGKPMWCGSQVDDTSSGCNFVKGMGADKDVCQDCPCVTSKSKTKTCPAGNAAPASPPGPPKKCGGTDLTADSDPTSLGSKGLACGTMCTGNGLNATWKPILVATMPMQCADQQKMGTKEKCLYDGKDAAGKPKLRDPPICQWTGTACAADMLEINCLMETLDMLCGCPAMSKPNFKPSAAVCGPSTGCGKALTGVTPTCAAKMDKDPSSPGLKILKAACGHGPAPPPGQKPCPAAGFLEVASCDDLKDAARKKACEDAAVKKLPTACLACFTTAAGKNDPGVCVDMVAVQLAQIAKMCPAEAAKCTANCQFEMKTLMAAKKDPSPSSGSEIRAIRRCTEAPPKATCPSGNACAKECGIPGNDWVAGSPPSAAQCACWARPTCSSNCPDGTISAASIRNAGCGKYEKGAVASKIKLAATMADVDKDRQKFITVFQTDVGTALKVDKARVGVTGIKAGSVVVDFTVAPDASGTSIAPAAITTAFKAPGVKIGATTTAAAVVAADVQTPKVTATPTYTAGSAVVASPPSPPAPGATPPPAASGASTVLPTALACVATVAAAMYGI